MRVDDALLLTEGAQRRIGVREFGGNGPDLLAQRIGGAARLATLRAAAQSEKIGHGDVGHVAREGGVGTAIAHRNHLRLARRTLGRHRLGEQRNGGIEPVDRDGELGVRRRSRRQDERHPGECDGLTGVRGRDPGESDGP